MRLSYSRLVLRRAACSSSFVTLSLSRCARNPGYCSLRRFSRSARSFSLSVVLMILFTSAFSCSFSAITDAVFSCAISFARSWVLFIASWSVSALLAIPIKDISADVAAAIPIAINPHGDDIRLFFNPSLAIVAAFVDRISAAFAFACAISALISSCRHAVIDFAVTR